MHHRAMRHYPPHPMLKNILPLVVIVLMVCGCASKGGGGAKAEKKKEVGFTPLFNGSDFAGWTYGTDKAGAQRV